MNTKICMLLLCFCGIMGIAVVTHLFQRIRRYKATIQRLKKQHVLDVLEAKGVPPINFCRIKTLWENYCTSDKKESDHYVFEEIVAQCFAKKIDAMSNFDTTVEFLQTYFRAMHAATSDKALQSMLSAVWNNLFLNLPVRSRLMKLLRTAYHDSLQRTLSSEDRDCVKKNFREKINNAAILYCFRPEDLEKVLIDIEKTVKSLT